MLDSAVQPVLVVHTLPTIVTGLPGLSVPVRGHVQVIAIAHSHLVIINLWLSWVKYNTDTYLLPLTNVSDGGHAGYEPELGVVKHHKLAIGCKAVITLVGQTAAIASNVLNMAPIIGHFMRAVSCKVTWAQVGISIVPPGMSAGSKILNKSFVVGVFVCHYIVYTCSCWSPRCRGWSPQGQPWTRCRKRWWCPSLSPPWQTGPHSLQRF